LRSALILSFLILFSSCAKKPAEEVDEAIDLALTYLSDGKCNQAIDVLEDVGRDLTNPIYLQVLASAYACRAGFDERTFLATDIPKIDSDAADLMKSLTTMTLSPETVADSDDYMDLLESVNILLYVDANQPSQAAREAKYGPRKAGDMGVQTLFLSMTLLGRFIHFYGNVDAAGAKGAGAASTDEQGATPSTCFVEYTEAQALAFIGGGGGSVCNNMGTDDGHPDMLFAPAATLVITKRRMCEGLMLVTNIVDILNNLTLPSDSSMGQLTNVTATVNTAIDAIITARPALEPLITTTSQAECETLVAAAGEFNNLQLIYAMLFDGGLP
jgi:hypothetical protein